MGERVCACVTWSLKDNNKLYFDANTVFLQTLWSQGVVMRLLGCGPQGGNKEGPEANSEEKAPREGGRGGAAPRELEVERWWPWGLGLEGRGRQGGRRCTS